jgi:hypothetical protein
LHLLGLVIARSDNDEAIQILAQACWIASLTLAMTQTKIVLATPVRPSSAYDHAQKDSLPARLREAKRRKAHANHGRAFAAASLRTLRNSSAARPRAIRGAPAFRRFDRGSRRRL